MSRFHGRRRGEPSLCALVLSTLLLTAARADEPGFKSIFNGKDLTGWRLGYTELAGKTASDDGRFAVKDGILVITGSKDTPPKMAEIDTAESYDDDFTLRLEFRASRDANSGVHLRDKAFAHQLQIRDYPRVGPYQALKGYKDGDWNAIEVVVTGTRARCTCNGELLEPALAIPGNGPLSLQSEINVVEYRNIRIKRENPAQQVRRDIPYANPGHERQVLDVYSPPGAKDRPVVFWIHGGGWQTGDKSSVQLKPRAFTDKGFVFVSTNYRLLPRVDMQTIVRDIARSIRWVHDHIAEYGGDPRRLVVMGHSAGAQLAALVCIDDRYLKGEGLSMAIIKGCVPVDGDTYDVPAIIETAETRRRVHGLPQATYGHREKFGNDPAKHRDFSAVTHVARDKGIPPFLIMHVAEHPDTSAQAQRLAGVLKGAGVPVRVFGARESTHNKINADLGRPDDPGTKALFAFVDEALKRRSPLPAASPGEASRAVHSGTRSGLMTPRSPRLPGRPACQDGRPAARSPPGEFPGPTLGRQFDSPIARRRAAIVASAR